MLQRHRKMRAPRSALARIGLLKVKSGKPDFEPRSRGSVF
jgi:hypothetical protein